MAAAITYSTNIINYSITNPNIDVRSAQDVTKPYTFLEFITNTGVDYSPEEYNTFYLSYLQTWATTKNAKVPNETESFIQYYVDFLKEIVITYATNQEKVFLSKLDFTDPVDLDVAIPFFTEKIRQIIIFYKTKRDDAKYTVDRNKIKGTGTSIEKGLFESIYNYVFSSQDEPVYAALGVSLSAITQNLQINVEEYVDVYGTYFDIPNTDNTTFYNYNTTDIDTTLFFGDMFEQIFSNEAFLKEIPFIVSVILKFNNLCDPENPLALVNANTTSGISPEDVIGLRKVFLSKYIGADIYYVDNTTGVPTSGVLVKAANPANNTNNLQYVSTPTLISTQQRLLRDVGLFFSPDKQGIFQLNTKNYSYSLDYAKLETGKIYFFPDPNKYGNVTKDQQADYPLIYAYDFRPDIKNASSGYAIGTPNVKNNEQTFAPYFATEQNLQNSKSDISLNFSTLFNEGYIKQLEYDIYGNEYALFIDKFGQGFKSTDTINLDGYEFTKNLLLDGHVFYDMYEGYNFNYETENTEGTTIRSGLSTHTVVWEGSPSFNLSSNPFYALTFREFVPYTELTQFKTAASTRRYASRDAYSFTYDNNTPLPDPVATTDPSFPTEESYYYVTFADAGVDSLVPLEHGATAPNFTLDVKLVLSATNVEVYDCGYYSDTYELDNDYSYSDVIPFVNTVPAYAMSSLESVTANDTYKAQAHKNQLQGRIFVRNGGTSSVQPISTVLSTIFNKYSNSATHEVYHNPINLEVFYNTICIETPSFLVFDKIMYDTDSRSFEAPSTKNTIFTIQSASPLNQFSNRFFNEKNNTVTFCALAPFITDSTGGIVTLYNSNSATAIYNSTNKTIMPTIYQYNVVDNSFKRLFPALNQIQQLSGTFTPATVFDSECSVNIIKIKKPVLTYNSLNDLYKFTYIGMDNNNMYHLFDYTFSIRDDRAIDIVSTKYYRHNKLMRTTDFTTNVFATVTVNSSSVLLSSSYVSGTELTI